MNTINTIKKLSDLITIIVNGRQRTQLTDSAGTEIGTAANPVQVDIVDATGITITADTEFPAAAAITDNFANPTTTSAMAMLMGYDGATWDRVSSGSGAAGNPLRVVLATDVGLPAGESHIGATGGNTSIIDVTFSGDGAAYATGDVIGATQTITNAMRVNNGTAVVQSIRLLDQDDVGIAIDVVFMQNTQSLGTDNDPVSITDANAIDILGHLSIAATDYTDLINSRSATIRNTGLGVQSAAASRNLFVGLIARGVGTFTASALRLRITFLQD